MTPYKINLNDIKLLRSLDQEALKAQKFCGFILERVSKAEKEIDQIFYSILKKYKEKHLDEIALDN